MALAPGTRLGPFVIEASIGAGGMGEVYRARDTKLERAVAIKVLPSLFAGDPDRLARFEREAQVLASLNHPHIAAIYGIESAGSTVALVLELVDGESLDRLIGPEGMPLADVLRLGIQMADALAAAHAAGVVHRDFKPGNVGVTRAGAAKVLDFGLAKSAAVESVGATVTGAAGPRTEAGSVMGTVAYMSPEQAAGRPVDARSDVFSFGSVLFEMITGRRAFDGDTSMSTLAAIIHQPARPVSQVRTHVPRELERLISRCHRKDPARRVQSMADLRVALEELHEDLEAGRLTASTAVAPAIAPGRRPSLALAAAGVLLAGAGLLAGRLWPAPEPPAIPETRLQRVTADIGLTTHPAVSAAGSLIAYASDRYDGSNRDIWVQPLGGGDPVRVTTHAADDSTPAFAPDGSRIAFRSERDGGGIYTVAALGGQERLLVRDGRDPRFSPDGKWLAYSTGGRGGDRILYVMPAAGGLPRRLLAGLHPQGSGIWSPDSTRVLVEARKENVFDLWIGGIAEDAGEPIPTGAFSRMNDPLDLVGWIGDRVFYTAAWGPGTDLRSIRFEKDAATDEEQSIYRTADRLDGVSVEPGGEIYFSSFSTRTSIWMAPVRATQPALGPPVPVTSTSAADIGPSLSADGSRLAFRSTRRPDAAAWFRDLSTGLEAALPSPGALRGAVISPNGKSVAYVGTRSPADLSIVDTGGGVPRRVCAACVSFLWSWTPDERYLLVNLVNSAGPQLATVDVATGTVTPLFEQGPTDRLWLARVSPDQRWVSFVDWHSADRTRVIIAPFAPGRPVERSSWIHVTDGSTVDEETAWAPDGRTLYFVSERDGFRCVYATGFDSAAGRVLGQVEPVLHMHGTRRTLLSSAAAPSRIDVAGGRLVFPVQELQGNIYGLLPVQKP